MAAPKIAAVVLQYGNWQKTADCIDSLRRSNLKPAWIIAVDNASPDDSFERLQEIYGASATVLMEGAASEPQPLTLLRRRRNGGYAAGNNAGLALGLAWGADAFLIINNDAWLEPEALGALWDKLSQCARPGICGPLLVYPTPDNLVQCCAGGHTNYLTGLSSFSGANLSRKQAEALNTEDIESGLNFICGACALVSRKFVEDVGLLNEGYFLYCEEQDWALRAKGRFDLAFAPNALVWHHEGATTGWNRYSFQWSASLRLMASRLRLAWLHHPWYLPTVAAACVFAAGRIFTKKLVARLFTPS